MRNELRYKVEIHAIFDMPRKEKNSLQFLHLIFFIFFNKNMLYGNNIIDLECKARSNL
jgi:hypothetical protein